ncbi:MAG: hypothetical protein V7784_19180 [Oceanospirillaceae bacterium]
MRDQKDEQKGASRHPDIEDVSVSVSVSVPERGRADIDAWAFDILSSRLGA